MNMFRSDARNAPLQRPWLSGGRIGLLAGGAPDPAWLDRWADVPLWPGEGEDGHGMAEDRYRIVLAERADRALLAAVGQELLHYRFYPSRVLEARGPFLMEDRFARDGDRIVQRLHILRFLGRPLLSMLSMAEVCGAKTGPDRWAIGYITTEHHPGRGWWRVWVELDAQQRLVLGMAARAKPSLGRLTDWPGLRSLHFAILRHYQHRAHRQGLASVAKRVERMLREREQAARPSASVAGREGAAA